MQFFISRVEDEECMWLEYCPAGLSGVELGALPADLSLLLALRQRAVHGPGVVDFWYAFAMVRQ